METTSLIGGSMVNNNDWTSWSVHIKKLVEKHDGDIDQMKIDIATMKVKWAMLAGFVGFVAGLIPTVVKLIFG